jgi:hypothetical protein
VGLDRAFCQVPHLSQRGAKLAGCHIHLTAEDRGEMTLVSEPNLLCDQRKGPAGPTQQGFCPLEPTLNDIALRPNPGRLLEGAAEVIGAETGDVGQHREREIVIGMGLDVVAHALQPLRRKTPAGRQREMTDKTPSNADI